MKHLLFPILLLLLSSCQEEAPHFPHSEANGFDDAALNDAVQAVRADGGVMSLMVNRNRVGIVEEYFGIGGAEEVHEVKSVTKSVTGLLFGMAIELGYIQGVDERVGDYLAEFLSEQDSVIASVRIRDLLTMTGGFDWNELTDPDWTYWNNWVLSDDHFNHALHVPIIHDPGTHFTYNTAACQILSGLFTVATGQTLDEFADTHLFAPLGIPGNRPWDSDQRGYNYGGVALELSAGDMMKLGLLMLNGGLHGEERILPAGWVEDCTFPWISTRNIMYYASDYGYFWWIGKHSGHEYYFANGWGGQFIVVFPDLAMVVVAQSELANQHRTSPEQWVSTLNLIMNDVLGALR